MNKRILIVAGVFYPEPIVSANLLTDLATELSKTYDVTVIRPKPTRPAGFQQSTYDNSKFNFKVIEIDSYTCPSSSLVGRFRESYSHGKICADYIRKNHSTIDFIYNDSWHLFGIYKVAKIAVHYRIPYMTPVQDIYPESLASKLPNISLLRGIVMRVLGPIDKYSLKHAEKIHTISEKMVGILSLTRNLPKDKFVVVRNWQNEEAFVNYRNDAQPISNNIFTFMYLGNIGPLAGVDILFEAFSKANLTNAKLVIAGSGSAKNRLIQKSKNYSCKIEFWDVPSGKVPEVQAQSDVMVLPVKKGFAMSSIPSKLPAYMFSGKPVLGSVDLASDTAKCILDSNCGWVVKPEDSDLLANQMKVVASLNRKDLEEKGEQGRKYALDVFSRKTNLGILVNACNEIINKK